MRNTFKIFALFLMLSFIFSGLIACTDSGATEIKPDEVVKKDSKNAETDNYPPTPEPIMTTELKALDETTFKVEDYKGKVLLLNLWATWCGPCIQEMPKLRAMEKKYKDDGFMVIGLNTDDETPEQIKAFAKKQKLNYKLGWAPMEVTKEFFKVSKLGGIPQSILINRNGNMVGVFRGGGQSVIKAMVDDVDKIMAKK